MKVIVVTGASSGFGALAARQLALAGHTVFAGIRETEGRNAPQVAALQSFAAEHDVNLRSIDLDVQSDASVEAGIKHVIGERGQVDVLVHNAGPRAVRRALRHRRALDSARQSHRAPAA